MQGGAGTSAGGERGRGSGGRRGAARHGVGGVGGVWRALVVACVPALLGAEPRDAQAQDSAVLQLHYAGGVGRHVQAVHGEDAACSVFSCRSKAAQR